MEWCKPEPAGSKGCRPLVRHHDPVATALAPGREDRQLLALSEPILPAQPGWEELMRASTEVSLGEKKGDLQLTPGLPPPPPLVVRPALLHAALRADQAEPAGERLQKQHCFGTMHKCHRFIPASTTP